MNTHTHRSQTHSLSQQFCAKWHVAYCNVPKSRVAEILRTGHLLHSDHPSGEVKLSPDIECACKIAAVPPGRCVCVGDINHMIVLVR